ncbi:MAG: integrase, partial [Acidobacteria bacterium]
MVDPSQVHVSGPLEPFAAGFANLLAQQGYTPNSATLQMYLMAHLSRWLAGQGLDAHELRATDVERFLSARRGAGYTQYLSGKAMRPMLTYLRDQGVSILPLPTVASGPMDVVLERYRQYLTKERGLSPSTVRGYLDAVRPFLSGRISPDGLTLDWDSLDTAAITAFVVARTPNQSRGAAKLTVTALRSLLVFLHVDGLISRPLA